MKNNFLILAIMICFSNPFVVLSQGLKGDLFETWGDTIPAREYSVPKGWREKKTVSGNHSQLPVGLSVFKYALEKEMSPYSAPLVSEISNKVRMFSAANEYVALVFGLYSKENISNLSLETTALVEEKNTKLFIPNSAIDARISLALPSINNADDKTYKNMPQIIVKEKQFSIKAKQNRQVWINVWVSPKTQPGYYFGKCFIKKDNKIIKTVNVRLRVLPFKLGKTKLSTAVWYTGYFGKWWPGTYKKNTPLHMKELHENGINSLYICNTPYPVSYNDGNFSVNTSLWLNSIVDAFMKAGMTGKLYLDARQINGWASNFGKAIHKYVQADKALPKKLSVTTGMEVPVFKHPVSLNAFKKCISEIESHAKNRNWPERYYFIQEEATKNAIRLEQLNYYINAMPEGTKTVLVSNGPRYGVDEADKVGDKLSVRSYAFIDQKLINKTRKSKNKLEIYNFSRPELGYYMGRIAYGFYPVRIGASGVSEWAYMFGGTNGFFYRPHYFLAYPAPKGPVPTTHMIKIREGIDDARYFHLLSDLISKAKKSKDGKILKAAEDAQKVIADILKQIPVRSTAVFKYAKNNNTNTYDIWRWKIAREIIKLQKLLKNDKK